MKLFIFATTTMTRRKTTSYIDTGRATYSSDGLYTIKKKLSDCMYIDGKIGFHDDLSNLSKAI